MSAVLRHPAVPYSLVLILSAVWAGMHLPGIGITADSLLELTRLTARTSVLFFIAAFAVGALAKITRSQAARQLVRNRRHIGLAFALAHFLHLGVLVAYFAVSGEDPGIISIVGGGTAYLMIAVMTATSNNLSMRKLGANWRKIHVVCSWYVWLIFLNSYTGRVLEGREPAWMFIAITALLLGAALLRLVVRVRARTEVTA
ncbi:MAG: hypothetical protein AAF993_12405 [Pseudomonadota bacterium]